ncbi:HAD-like domain-containing protein [Naematelia encephala]|uniref:HAD-like domain-containing protein n=1 Tax=Naematelia encephala TaxID=71784 RepID=A0A1Y2AH04_9TREE|nr:HAD-like domain-containing protein [Naematelia encephala]
MTTVKSTVTVSAILFDLDGTLIKTTGAAEAAWLDYANRYEFDYKESLKSAHGMRVQDLIRIWCKITDPTDLIAETRRLEDRIIELAKELAHEGKGGIQVLPGVKELLDKLNGYKDAKWAIVTSGTKHLADQTLQAANLPIPLHMTTADDVSIGKPDPEPYLVAARSLGVGITKCQTGLVVEDAPSGIKAGVASGAKVLAVCSSHPRAQIDDLGADWILNSLET